MRISSGQIHAYSIHLLASSHLISSQPSDPSLLSVGRTNIQRQVSTTRTLTTNLTKTNSCSNNKATCLTSFIHPLRACASLPCSPSAFPPVMVSPCRLQGLVLTHRCVQGHLPGGHHQHHCHPSPEQQGDACLHTGRRRQAGQEAGCPGQARVRSLKS